jgi:hypothetical protein
MTEYQLLVVICVADVCSSILLFVEYFWGRSDTDMKSEAKRKRKFREKYRWEHLTTGEHQ